MRVHITNARGGHARTIEEGKGGGERSLPPRSSPPFCVSPGKKEEEEEEEGEGKEGYVVQCTESPNGTKGRSPAFGRSV